MESPTSIDPQALAKLHGLRLRARHIVEGYIAGRHRSPYRGFSIEFAEHREYAPGDDLRYVDWKVFGKSDKFYLKQFEDETNLQCYLVLDISQSMTYASSDTALSKLAYAQSLCAALAWLILQQQDAVGLATFDDQIRALVRSSASPTQREQIIATLDSATPGKATAAGRNFHELAQRLTQRGVVIILSDFFDDLASLAAGLRHIRHRKHDVILLHLLDPAELEFPFDRPTRFRGLENLPSLQADPRAIRAAYLREISAFRNSLELECSRQSIDYFLLRTDEPFDAALTRVLSDRGRTVH